MTLAAMMTTTATTKRTPAISSGKISAPVAHLSGVKITPVMLPSASGQLEVKRAIGLPDSATQIFETYTESHAHTDGGTPVTQLPDIRTGDRLVVGSDTYTVRWAEQQPATSTYGATLILYLTEDKRL